MRVIIRIAQAANPDVVTYPKVGCLQVRLVAHVAYIVADPKVCRAGAGGLERERGCRADQRAAHVGNQHVIVAGVVRLGIDDRIDAASCSRDVHTVETPLIAQRRPTTGGDGESHVASQGVGLAPGLLDDERRHIGRRIKFKEINAVAGCGQGRAVTNRDLNHRKARSGRRRRNRGEPRGSRGKRYGRGRNYVRAHQVRPHAEAVKLGERHAVGIPLQPQVARVENHRFTIRHGVLKDDVSARMGVTLPDGNLMHAICRHAAQCPSHTQRRDRGSENTKSDVGHAAAGN